MISTSYVTHTFVIFVRPHGGAPAGHSRGDEAEVTERAPGRAMDARGADASSEGPRDHRI
jgi:hypothetical protein